MGWTLSRCRRLRAVVVVSRCGGAVEGRRRAGIGIDGIDRLGDQGTGPVVLWWGESEWVGRVDPTCFGKESESPSSQSIRFGFGRFLGVREDVDEVEDDDQ